MTIKPLSVQLYSLRDAAARDMTDVLKRVAGMGYMGVEPAGFHGLSPEAFRRIVDDLGMDISSTHSPWCTPETISQVVETAGVLGVRYVTCGFGPDAFESQDAIRRTAETVNRMLESLSGTGLTLIQHNHSWEFEMLDGQLKYERFSEDCPDVQFELDVYWAANFGAVDAAAQVSRFSGRTPFLHIKDGPLERDRAMLPVGQGKMNIPACIEAADPDVLQWLVVELDSYDGDMFDAVEKSYRHLTEAGLALGRK